MNKFKIVVPVFNSKDWIEKCISSIKNQTIKEIECIIIDDCSNDITGTIIDGMALDSRFTVIHNTNNNGALANIVTGFQKLKSLEDNNSILLVVDGDDWLATEYSLEIVNKAYNINPNLLLTYGNHVHWPTNGTSNCKYFPANILLNNSYRNYELFITSHLRTFKSKLWNSIKDEDLKNPTTNEYWRTAWDCAMMYPMLEMAGSERFKFIEQILYIYNRQNPLSDDIIHATEQTKTFNYIRTLKKYELVI